MAGDNLYQMTNHGTLSTTVAAGVTTNTASPNVLLQLSTPSTRQFTLVEYGLSFDGSPAAIKVELRSTSATATFSTNGTAGIITPFTNPNAPTSLSTSGTSNSCFNNGGAIIAPVGTVSAYYDLQFLSTNTYVKQWPLNREPGIPVSNFLELIVQATAAVNAYCYFIWRE